MGGAAEEGGGMGGAAEEGGGMDGWAGTAWMLEFRDPERPGCVLPGAFLSAGPGGFGVAPSAAGGLRLARREDAEALAAVLLGLLGDPPGGAPMVATEHAWGPA